MKFNPEEFLIFEAITGSRLYGTNTEMSDTDKRGVCIPPMRVLLDPFQKFEQKDSFDEDDDRTIFNLEKFFKLCADCNPNIVELLFIPDDKVLFMSDAWEKVLENRNLFLSKKAKWTFTGYAFSQVGSIKSHRKYFTNPPKRKPMRSDFGLKETPTISGDGLNALANSPMGMLKDEYINEIGNEVSYKKAMEDWHDYVAWRDARNPVRKKMEEDFGYDCKKASHTFRLMQEGKELLTTGGISFPLENASELLAVKNGRYSFDEFMEKVEAMESDFDKWFEESMLPYGANKVGISNLYFELLKGANL